MTVDLDNPGKRFLKLITKPPDPRTGLIAQELWEEADTQCKKLLEWTYETKEEGVKNALMQLGWTPPPFDVDGKPTKSVRTCDRCKFFKYGSECTNEKLEPGRASVVTNDDWLTGGAYSGYGDYITMGPKFGCIHWEPKEDSPEKNLPENRPNARPDNDIGG